MDYIDKIIDKRKNCDRVAICEISTNREISYKDLYERVYGLCYSLDSCLHINRQDKVLVLMNKSIECIISFFSIMKLGAIFIPIDESLPNERLQYIINNSEAKYVVSTRKLYEKFESIINAKLLQVLIYEESSIITNTIGPIVEKCNKIKRSLKDIAYIIYTSGTTGNPKGVMIRNESFSAFVKSIVQAIPYYDENSIYLSVFPIHFDASMVDIYPTLSCGGKLVLMKRFLMPNHLLEILSEYEVTMICMPSTIIKLLLSKYSSIREYKLEHLKLIWYGTESCPAKTIRELMELFPQTAFIHSYGPTEATCTSHVFYCDRENIENEDDSFPIGKGLKTIQSYALNQEGNIIKPGEIGELYISGVQVMERYCNNEEQTNKVLCKSVLNLKEVAYKTGDYVSVDEQGNYIFRGRKDDMVKCRGKLVYMKEVEQRLVSYPNVYDAIVVSFQDEMNITQMKAFIILNEDASIDIKDIRKWLVTKLPTYMIPIEFRIIDIKDIPINANGKIDRNHFKKSKSF